CFRNISEKSRKVSNICLTETYTRNEILIHGVDYQVIHAVIDSRRNGGWLCSGVYANPNATFRENLWSAIEEVGAFVGLPWLLTGDFNEVLSVQEKRGGNLPVLSRCNRFKDMIDACGLIDLGFRGPKFTWSDSRVGLAKIRERIDRCLANVGWQELFPESMVLHLPRTHSDHHPLLTLCDGMAQPPPVKPFRFELAWTTNDQCKELVAAIWKDAPSIFGAIDRLPKIMREWNRNSFGNIFENKRRLLARINGIQKCLCQEENPFLSSLEKYLIEEYNEILKQEELFWFQKSRTQWLSQGDRNTRFYHMTTISRRRRNKITALKINAFNALNNMDCPYAGGLNQDWKWIWRFKCSEKIKFFIWLCQHNSIATNALRLLGMPWESRLSHTLRSGNCCADALAAKGYNVPGGLQVWEEPPEDLLPLLVKDSN
ncbi:hypothetical protein RD792_001150, partial [Penstemon davidsonii]